MRVQQPQVGVAFARLKVFGRVVVGRKPVTRKEQQDAQPTDRTYSDQIDATRHGFLLPRFAAGGQYFLHKNNQHVFLKHTLDNPQLGGSSLR